MWFRAEFRAKHSGKFLAERAIRMGGIRYLKGEILGGDGHRGVGHGSGIYKAAIMNVNQQVEVGEEIGADDRESNVSYDEVPGVGFSGDSNFFVKDAVCLDRGAVGGPKTDGGAPGRDRGVGIWYWNGHLGGRTLWRHRQQGRWRRRTSDGTGARHKGLHTFGHRQQSEHDSNTILERHWGFWARAWACLAVSQGRQWRNTSEEKKQVWRHDERQQDEDGVERVTELGQQRWKRQATHRQLEGGRLSRGQRCVFHGRGSVMGIQITISIGGNGVVVGVGSEVSDTGTNPGR